MITYFRDSNGWYTPQITVTYLMIYSYINSCLKTDITKEIPNANFPKILHSNNHSYVFIYIEMLGSNERTYGKTE